MMLMLSFLIQYVLVRPMRRTCLWRSSANFSFEIVMIVSVAGGRAPAHRGRSTLKDFEGSLF